MRMENQQENVSSSQRESINIKNRIEDNREKWEELKKGYYYQRRLFLKYNEIAGFRIIIKQLREFFVSEINISAESVFPLITDDPEAFSMYKLIDIIDAIIAFEYFYSVCVRCGEKTWGKQYCYDCGGHSYTLYTKSEMTFRQSIKNRQSNDTKNRIREIKSFEESKKTNNEKKLELIYKITAIMGFGSFILGFMISPARQILFLLGLLGLILAVIVLCIGNIFFGWDLHSPH